MEVFLIIVVTILLSAAFSGGEIGLYSINRVKLRYRTESGRVGARLLNWLANPIAPSIVTILIGNNIAAQILTTEIDFLLIDLHETTRVVLTTLVVTPILLIFGEFLPKQIFRVHADALMDRMAWLLALCRMLFIIPVTIIHTATKPFLRGDVDIFEPHQSRPALRSFLLSQEHRHTLTPLQQSLFDRVLSLERLRVNFSGVTKSLKDITMLDSAATAAAARKGLGPKYFQRYVISDHQNGEPIGSLTAAALATAHGATRLEDILQPLLRIPQEQPLHEALQAMHHADADLALVIDDDGQAIGVAFRNDCLRILTTLD